jgi:SAM-dependent methyltransferase
MSMSSERWDAEYARGGIPSSTRSAPSAAVVWAVESWERSAKRQLERALDVGCGRGRNARYLVARGIRVTAFDASERAITDAMAEAMAGTEFLQHDLGAGLPASNGEIDLLVDVFVYKHQVRPDDRAAYRQEMLRVLAADGRVLLSLAEPTDGYYGACPPAPDAGAAPNAVLDRVAGVQSVLFTLAEIEHEMADGFELEMAWRKSGAGQMHGRDYERRSLATIWRRVS